MGIMFWEYTGYVFVDGDWPFRRAGPALMFCRDISGVVCHQKIANVAPFWVLFPLGTVSIDKDAGGAWPAFEEYK